VGFWGQANDVQGREMLTRVGRLFERYGGLSFHYKSIEVFRQQNRNGLRQSADDTCFDVVDFIENAEGAVLKDRVSIQY
jgi:hypothetical protein